MIVVNLGTEPRPHATLENAQRIVDRMCADLGLHAKAMRRRSDGDHGGFFGFVITRPGAKVARIAIDVPGDDPDEFFAGASSGARRMYVDYSSWFWPGARAILAEKLGR